MAKRAIPIIVSSEELAKHLQSSTLKAATTRSNQVFFSNAHVHNQADAASEGTVKATELLESFGEAAKGSVDTAWDTAKKTAQNVIETTTAEADTNVVDTVEYRSTEDLKGQLGDGCDKKVEL